MKTSRKGVELVSGRLIFPILYASGWFLFNAWLADDAFISYRVVENFIAGYGLRWNVVERVQAFTHPLWLLLHIPFSCVMPVEMTAFVLGFLCVAALWFTLQKCFPRWEILFLYLMLPAWASLCVSEFAVSGLEVSLTYLLIAILWYVTFRIPEIRPGTLRLASLLISFLCLSRLDMILLVFPSFLALILRSRMLPRQVARAILPGLLPLGAWYLFSMLYYGFPLPNTYYAKLNTGIPAADSIPQGVRYLADLFQRDLIAGVYLLIAVPAAVVLIVRWKHLDWRTGRMLLSWTLGVIFYSLYIIRIGGDFMFGRFWAPAVLASMLTVATIAENLSSPRTASLAGAVLAVFFFAAGSFQYPSQDLTISKAGITDERKFYAATNLLLHYSLDRSYLVQEGLRFQKQAAEGKFKIFIARAIGMTGLFSGPGVTIIDQYALTDPYLARLPVNSSSNWRIGHFRRELPQGYIDARATGNFSSLDPNLASYFLVIREIVSGPLFSLHRLKLVALFNAGRFRPALQSYLQSQTATVPGQKGTTPVP